MHNNNNNKKEKKMDVRKKVIYGKRAIEKGSLLALKMLHKKCHYDKEDKRALLKHAWLFFDWNPIIQWIITSDDYACLKNMCLLHDYCNDNQLSRVKMLVDCGIDVNQRPETEVSALEVAARTGNVELVEYLLNLRPPITVIPSMLLYQAVRNPDIEVLQYLLRSTPITVQGWTMDCGGVPILNIEWLWANDFIPLSLFNFNETLAGCIDIFSGNFRMCEYTGKLRASRDKYVKLMIEDRRTVLYETMEHLLTPVLTELVVMYMSIVPHVCEWSSYS